MTLTATSSEVAAIPDVITALVPGVDLKAMDAMLSKIKVAKPGTLYLELDLPDKGAVELTLNLLP